MPVNSDGTGWHESHAFGDFCYICHAGNQQATDKSAAHEGMVAPLSDIKASCQQCHVDDLEERAQVYATTLGVEIGAGGASTTGASQTSTSDTGESANEAVAPAAVSAPIVKEIDVNDPNLVDYVQRYNEIVLGQKPTNLGNTILWVLILVVVVGGVGFVTINEVNKALNKKAVDGTYAPDVVEMLPDIENLKPKTRNALKGVLKSEKANKTIALMGELASDDED
jgi:hypothetical protein